MNQNRTEATCESQEKQANDQFGNQVLHTIP